MNLRKARTVFGCPNPILYEIGSEPLKSAEGINNTIDLTKCKRFLSCFAETRKRLDLFPLATHITFKQKNRYLD